MRIIFSAGDVNGIGLEIFYKLLRDHADVLSFAEKLALACESGIIAEYFSALGYDDFQIQGNILEIRGREIEISGTGCRVNLEFGKTAADSGANAAASLQIAADKVRAGEYDAVVTLPISKEACKLAGWNYPGQTEFFADLESNPDPLMILFAGDVRVALATVHIPLREVSSLISKESIFKKIEAFHSSLKRDFGKDDPHIAVLGLNPHAGENGGIGHEESGSISPAIAAAKRSGIAVSGTFPADGFFAHGEYLKYDGILAMYHDQGLIPLKLLAGGGGVNFTAGLEMVRTSPDHGTAFGIAGKGIADPQSLADAVVSSYSIYRNRQR